MRKDDAQPISTAAGKNHRSFAKGELIGLAAAFWNGFWKSTLSFAALFGIWLAFEVWNQTPVSGGPPLSSPWVRHLFEGIAILGFSFFYAWPLGVLVGVLSASWRLLGVWTLLPLAVFPLVLCGMLWLTQGFVSQQAWDIVDAFAQAYRANGMPATSETFEGARIAHAGPIALLVVVFLIPPLVVDSLRLVLEPAVILQILQFLLALSAVFVIGVLASVVICALPLLSSFFRRLRLRREKFRLP